MLTKFGDPFNFLSGYSSQLAGRAYNTICITQKNRERGDKEVGTVGDGKLALIGIVPAR